jgi:hypothetical protein
VNTPPIKSNSALQTPSIIAPFEETRRQRRLNFALLVPDDEAEATRVGCPFPMAERESTVPCEAWLLPFQSSTLDPSWAGG